MYRLRSSSIPGLLLLTLLCGSRVEGAVRIDGETVSHSRRELLRGTDDVSPAEIAASPWLSGAGAGSLDAVVPVTVLDADSLNGNWQLVRSRALFLHTAVYDALNQRMVVFGGAEGEGNNETNTFDLLGSGGWTNLQPAGPLPSARFQHAAILDPLRNRLIVHGGRQNDGVIVADVWSLNLVGAPAWTNITPAVAGPSLRIGHKAIYDPDLDRMIVFGGSSGGVEQGDVWALNLSGVPVWTNITPAGGPGGRWQSACTYDPVRKRLITFGGQDGSNIVTNTLWALDLNGAPTWANLGVATMPPPAAYATLDYDPVGDRLVLLGGTPDFVNYHSAAWEFPLGGAPAWSQLSPAGPGPGPVAHHTTVYDPLFQRVVLYGGGNSGETLGTVWSLDLVTPAWTALTPSEVSPDGVFQPGVAYDPVTQTVYRYGGVVGGVYPTGVYALSVGSGNRWSRIEPAAGPAPQPRQSMAVVFDEVARKLVLFGGINGTTLLADTWELDFSLDPPVWTNRTSAGPTARWGTGAVLDRLRNRMLVLGGFTGSATNQVWALDLAAFTWSQLSGGVPPPAFYRHTAVYDPIRDRVLVFGGTGLANGTFAFNLAGVPAWSTVPVTGTLPAPRVYSSAVYDVPRDRMVIFGGRNTATGTTYYNDVFALTPGALSTWSQLSPGGTLPAARYGMGYLFDPGNGQMVIHAGSNSAFTTGETWLLRWPQPDAGTDLTTPSLTPSARYLVELTRESGSTRDPGVAGRSGVHEFSSHGGDGDPWWRLNDDAPSVINTRGGAGEDDFGWVFKEAVELRSLRFDNVITGSSGTFTATPDVETWDGATWSPVAVSWSPAYDPSFGTGTRSYEINLSAPAANVHGVRLRGQPAGIDDGDGYVAVSELVARGYPGGRSRDYADDLTSRLGTEVLASGTQRETQWLIDDDLASVVTTAGTSPGAEHVLGALWPTPADTVTALGAVFRISADGGWFDEGSEAIRVEVTRDAGATWEEVTGLAHDSYSRDVAALVALPQTVESGFLFAFDPVHDVDGIRIVGDGGGTGEGFVAVTELEVFGTTTWSAQPPTPKLETTLVDGVNQAGFVAGASPTLEWTASAPGIDPASVEHRTQAGGDSPFLVSPFEGSAAWPEVPTRGDGVGDEVPIELFQTARYDQDPVAPAQPLAWSFPVPNGNYVVTLYFAEMSPDHFDPGDRVFDVWLEDIRVRDDLDIAAFAGPRVARGLESSAAVGDGSLDLVLTREVGDPILMGVQIAPASAITRPIYRVNAGGPLLTAVDGSYPAFAADDPSVSLGSFGAAFNTTLGPLAEGVHQLRIESRAHGAIRDTLHQVFQVDLTAPTVSFITPTPPESAWVAGDSTALGITGTDNAVPRAQLVTRIEVDDVLQPTPPGGGPSEVFPILDLAEGDRRIDVQLVDPAGNQSPVITRLLRVDATAPETFITAPDPGATLLTSTVQLTVSGTDALSPAVQFSYAVDAGAFGAPVAGPTLAIPGLADGPHTIRVRAVDAAGNADATPAELAIVVDANAPDLAFTVAPDPGACITTTLVPFEWTASDAVTPAPQLAFETRVDAGQFVPVGADLAATFGPLAPGQHTVSVRVTDLVGHARTVSRTFKVDPDPPVVFAPTARLLDAALLRFQCSGSDGVGVTGFRLQVATAPDFAAPLVDQVLSVVGQLDLQSTPGLTYFYRAAALDCAGNASPFSDPPGALAVPSLPDLVVESVSASAGAVIAGQSVGVAWSVRNQALGGTSNPNWHDQLYLSADLDLDLDGTDILLAEFANLTHLAPAELYARDEVVTLPRGIGGTWHVLVTTDFYDDLPESIGTNNVLASGDVDVTPADAANLETTSLRTLPFEEWVAGANMRVEWTVENTGRVPADTDRWYDTVFLSDDATFDVQVLYTNQYQFLDRPIGSVQFVGLLDSSATYTQDQQIRLPLDLQDRDYWLFVVADQRVTAQNQVVAQLGEVFENGADLNVSPAFRIHARTRLPANLVIDPATAPAAALSGETIPVEWTVHNDGDTTVTNLWLDRVYLSMDDALDAGDTQLGSHTRNAALSQLDSYVVTLPVTLPSFIEGSFRLLVRTDATDLLNESDEGDNVAGSVNPIAITLAPTPDFVVQSASAPTAGMAGTTIGVQWRVGNVGVAAAAGPWSDRIYLTTSDVWNPAGAIALESTGGPGVLASAGFYDRQAAPGLPFSLAPGTYWLWIVTDGFGQVTEYLAEGNNVLLAGAIAVASYPPVDLDVTPLGGPVAIGSGATASVEWSVTNLGQAATIASSWRDRVYLSTDATFGPGDVPLATMVHGGALAPGASYTQGASITLPNGIGGTYFLVVRTDIDDATGDTNPANDEEPFAGPLEVSLTPPPNLVVESLVPAASPVAGQPFDVQWVEHNVGSGATLPGSWSTYLYASLDPVYGNGDDVLVASRGNGGPLAGGESAPATVTFDVPRHFTGPYYLLARIDATSGVYESDEGDNVIASPPIQVALAPPADLVVTAVTPPATVIPGQPATIAWTIANIGPNRATGVMRDVVYLSADAEFDPATDRVLGLLTRTIDLEPEQLASATMVVKVEESFTLSEDGELIAAVPALSPGPHYAFVRTNALRNIRETDYENDVVDPGAPFDVVIPVLPIDGEDTATLARGEAAFWRIDTPPGKDLLVTVESSQPGATNELFASLGRTPDPRTFDFSGPAEFTPSPFLAIPSTADGSYFIRVSNNTLPSGVPTTTLTVRARLLPYSLTSITPNRAGGQATCTVLGAGFTPETRFSLDLGQLGPLEGNVLARVNSGVAVVRFDVSGYPTGPVTVRAVTGDSVATLVDGFTIETGTPYDVATSIEGSDVVRQNATATHTVRFTNLSNRDIPFFRARILLAPELEVVNLAPTGGLQRRSDLWPSLYAPLTGDVLSLVDTARDDTLKALDLVARDVPPGREMTVLVTLRGFARDTHSLRTLIRLDETQAFLASLVDEIEASRQAALASGVPIEPSLEPLVGDPFAMRDSALSQTWVASGFLSRKTVTQFVLGLPPGSLGTTVGGPPPAPPGLDPGTGPCDLPSDDPGCTLRDATLSELPPCRTCYETLQPVSLLLPARFDAALPVSSCGGYTGTTVRDVEVVSPCDPNLIASTSTPTAFGTILGERWIPKNSEVEYTVYFENTRETATTAAKDVRISVPVPANMDGNSFRLRGYWFGAGAAGAGGHSRSFGSGVISHEDEFLFGDVYVSVQMSGGADSALFLFSTPSDAGFLPVNDASQRGQGGVIFRLKPRADAVSGGRVAALARIRFDSKPALVTNTDSLRVDALPPTSLVTSAEPLDSTNVRIRWAGQDDPQGTGVRTYDLYMRRDAAPFTLVQADLAGTEAVLPLSGGSEYGFYTRARDNTLNLQAAPSGDQVAITLPGVVAVPGDDVPRVFALYQNAPNPFRGESIIRFDLPREADATLEIYNVAGRRLSTLLGGKRFPAGRHQAVLDARWIPAGVYFYRLRAGNDVSSRKLIILGQ